MKRAAPLAFALDDWSMGWDNVSQPASLDARSLALCLNCNLTPKQQKAGFEKRSGCTKLYPTAAATAPVMDFYEYVAPDKATYVLTVCGTKIRYYYDDAVGWHDLATVTAGQRYYFATHQGLCYICNGVDDNQKLHNTDNYASGIAAPTMTPTVVDGGVTGGQTYPGTYQYVYCYRRSAWAQYTGNPSPASLVYSQPAADHHNHVTVQYSADPQVDKVVLYRTVNLTPSGDPTVWLKVTEIANVVGVGTVVIDDALADAALGTACEIDNTVPPKAYFVTLFGDRLFYANCPSETDGGSLVMFSKTGKGEAVPSVNYFYFDRDDGQVITGACSIGNYYVVFKKNKIAVIDNQFTALRVISLGIGCIAPWAILKFSDRCIFLAEEGWKVFDGMNIFDLTGLVGSLLAWGYISQAEAAHYSAAYYPARHQFHYLIDHTTASNRMVMVGHFLTPLLFIEKGIAEQPSENLVAWTYHRYDNVEMTAMGSYTDAMGIQRLISGSIDGYVYLLDSGMKDDTTMIKWEAQSGWLALNEPESVEKTIRSVYLQYATTDVGDIHFNLAADYTPPEVSVIQGTSAAFCGFCWSGYSWCGMDGSMLDMVNTSRQGRIFKFGFDSEAEQGVGVDRLTAQFRIGGLR